MSGGPHAVWAWPTRHSLAQRLRSSEKKREQAGTLAVLRLQHAEEIPAVRYRTCRWVLVEQRPDQPIFCTAPVARAGCSWCLDHLAVVFIPREVPHG